MTLTQAGRLLFAVGGVCGVFALGLHLRDRIQRRRIDRRRADTPPPGPEADMPGHPERVRQIGDPRKDQAFGDIAEQLLDDGLADVAERAGWLR